MPYSSQDARAETALRTLGTAGLSQTIADLKQKVTTPDHAFEQLYAEIVFGHTGFARVLVWIGLPNHQKHLFFTHPNSITHHGQKIELTKLLCGTCQQSEIPGQLMGIPDHGFQPDSRYDALKGYFFAHPDFFKRSKKARP